MKKYIIVLFLLFYILSVSFADNSDFDVMSVVKREDFALSQRLQLDTIAAKYESNNKVYLSEIYARDLVPTTSEAIRDYYSELNTRISGLEKINTQRERLEYLLNEKKKSAIFSAVPNPLSVLTVAATAGNPIKAIISISGMALNSTAGYLSAKNQANLEHIQAQWALDDMQKDELNRLITDLYEFKCNVVKELDIPEALYRKLTLSNDDMESFLKIKKITDSSVRYAKLSALNTDGRLDYLAEYWAELAKAAYEMDEYNTALGHISKYERLYVNVFYHDEEYANVLMIKAFCLDMLYVSGFKSEIIYGVIEKIWSNVRNDDWERKYYCASMCGRLYEESEDEKYRTKSYEYLSAVIGDLITDYEIKADDYISGEYIEASKSQIENGIKEKKDQYNSKKKDMNTYLKDGGKKKDVAYKNLETELKELKTEQEGLEKNLKDFEKECKSMLPPSSEEVCNLFKIYVVLTEELKMSDDALFKANKKHFVDVVGKRDKQRVLQIFKDMGLGNNRLKTFVRKEEFEIDIPLDLVSIKGEYGGSILSKGDISVELRGGSVVVHRFPNCEVEIQRTKGGMDSSFLVIKCKEKFEKWEKIAKASNSILVCISVKEQKFSVKDFICSFYW